MDPTPLDDLLQPDLSVPAEPALREQLLARTTRVLRWRRWRRRAGLVGALAACYVAGLLTMRLLVPSHGSDVAVVVTPPAPNAVVRAVESELDTSALALEWRAADSQEGRTAFLRRAGDRYLNEEGDVLSALRCYRQLLDAGTAEGLKMAADDNWLLIALKDARQKEKRDAKNDG